MAKQSQIDKAIAQLEAEKAVLDMAIARLKAQQTPAKPKKAPKPRGAVTATNGE
jgi:hypothetical protein